DVAAVHDQALGADLRGRVHVLLEQLAGGDPDAVVRGRDVDDVRRVDVQVDAGGLGRRTQGTGPTVVPDLGALVVLGVPEEELDEVGAAGDGLGDRVGLVDVGTDAQGGGGVRHGIQPRTACLRWRHAPGADGHHRQAGREGL